MRKRIATKTLLLATLLIIGPSLEIYGEDSALEVLLYEGSLENKQETSSYCNSPLTPPPKKLIFKIKVFLEGALMEDNRVSTLSATFDMSSSRVSVYWDTLNVPTKTIVSLSDATEATVKGIVGANSTTFEGIHFDREYIIEAVSCYEDNTPSPPLEIQITPSIETMVVGTIQPQSMFGLDLLLEKDEIAGIHSSTSFIEEECVPNVQTFNEATACSLFLVRGTGPIRGVLDKVLLSTLTSTEQLNSNSFYIGRGSEMSFDRPVSDVVVEIASLISPKDIMVCDGESTSVEECFTSLPTDSVVGLSDAYVLDTSLTTTMIASLDVAVMVPTGGIGDNANSTPTQHITEELLATSQVLIIGGFDSGDCIRSSGEEGKYCSFETYIESAWCGEIAKEWCILFPAYLTLPTSTQGVSIEIANPFVRVGLALGTFNLVQNAYPELSSKEIVNLFRGCTDDIGVPGPDNETGLGVLNLECLLGDNLLGFVNNPKLITHK